MTDKENESISNLIFNALWDKHYTGPNDVQKCALESDTYSEFLINCDLNGIRDKYSDDYLKSLWKMVTFQ